MESPYIIDLTDSPEKEEEEEPLRFRDLNLDDYPDVSHNSEDFEAYETQQRYEKEQERKEELRRQEEIAVRRNEDRLAEEKRAFDRDQERLAEEERVFQSKKPTAKPRKPRNRKKQPPVYFYPENRIYEPILPRVDESKLEEIRREEMAERSVNINAKLRAGILFHHFFIFVMRKYSAKFFFKTADTAGTVTWLDYSTKKIYPVVASLYRRRASNERPALEDRTGYTIDESYKYFAQYLDYWDRIDIHLSSVQYELFSNQLPMLSSRKVSGTKIYRLTPRFIEAAPEQLIENDPYKDFILERKSRIQFSVILHEYLCYFVRFMGLSAEIFFESEGNLGDSIRLALSDRGPNADNSDKVLSKSFALIILQRWTSRLDVETGKNSIEKIKEVIVDSQEAIEYYPTINLKEFASVVLEFNNRSSMDRFYASYSSFPHIYKDTNRVIIQKKDLADIAKELQSDILTSQFRDVYPI